MGIIISGASAVTIDTVATRVPSTNVQSTAANDIHVGVPKTYRDAFDRMSEIQSLLKVAG